MTHFVHRATGSGAISQTVTPSDAFELVCVRLHMSATGGASENLIIAQDALAGSAYDTTLTTQAMAAVQDLLASYDPPVPFVAGDKLTVTYANTNSRTWGLEVVYRY